MPVAALALAQSSARVNVYGGRSQTLQRFVTMTCIDVKLLLCVGGEVVVECCLRTRFPTAVIVDYNTSLDNMTLWPQH